MKIGLLAPAWYPVPPPAYGGIERIVSLLADGLVHAGHDVTLFASGDSRTIARLEFIYERAPASLIGQSLPELQHALHALVRTRGLDVFNDHTSPLGATLLGLMDVPCVHTVHGALQGTPGALYEDIVRVSPNVRFISISKSQRRGHEFLPWAGNCYNAVNLDEFPFDIHTKRGDHLLFLGRMCEEKGAHRAIEVARAAGLPLKIAAKQLDPQEHQYFHDCVEPLLGGDIEYLGEVGHEAKLVLLQGARALLCPLSWEEPFGMVMIEAMAMGVPVIATRRGSVPEVIEPGRSGVIVDDTKEMVDAIAEADALDPNEIRLSVAERFSPARLVASYLSVYERLLAAEGSRWPVELSALG